MTRLLAAVVVIGMWLATAGASHAQRRDPGGVRTEVDERLVRAEYAGVLLQSGRYDEAATEFRTLLRTDSTRIDWRLGLARALAWSGQSREAERELVVVRRARKDDAEVEELLRATRAAIVEPSAAEAARWLAEAPESDAYRVALARALLREGEREAALAQLDTLIARGPTVERIREIAGVYGAAGDSIAAARWLGRAVARAPGDSALRLDWARALAWAGDQPGALAQYDLLIARAPDAQLLFERGRLRAWTGDLARAERDLQAAVELRPTAEAYAMLGDVRRWRGSWRRAREAYAQALALAEDDPAILAAVARLDREERLAAGAALAGATPGWTSRSTWSEDNAGFLYLATGVAHGMTVGARGVLALGVEQRRISHRSHADVERWITGWTAEAALAHTFDRATVDVRGGLARHALTGITPVAHLAVSAWLPPARLTVAATRAPMYASLMSARSLVQWTDGELTSAEPLEGSTLAASAAVPLGDVELWIGAERLILSDGNDRRSAALGARYEVAPNLSLLYSGGQLGFARESNIYWDPRRHQSHALGVEWAWRAADALAGRLRVQRGIGWTSEALAISTDSVIALRSRQTPQMGLGGEVTWRGRWWDAGAELRWSRGRTGGYQALHGGLVVRIDWLPRAGSSEDPLTAGDNIATSRVR